MARIANAETTPPVIKKVQNTTPTNNSVTITWDTDKPSDSMVKYGLSSNNYNFIEKNATYVTLHSITLTGLSENTKYYYVVNSTDKNGNSNQSREYTFTTTMEIDTTPPVIHSVKLNATEVISGEPILVTVNATDNIGVVSVTANGNALTQQSEDIWTGVIIAIEGVKVPVNIIAYDGAGNNATAIVTYNASKREETIPPILIINRPINGSSFNISNITVSGTAYDESGIAEVTVQGEYAGTTEWSKQLTLSEGSNTIKIIATDNAGNNNTTILTVNYTPVRGDFNDNGRVDIGDATYVAYMVVGKVPEDLKADFNGNGRVDIGDAAKIAYYLVGKISEL
ncbi:MAG: fibronectin type III domain-containing protein [Methanosarcinales archaeon]